MAYLHLVVGDKDEDDEEEQDDATQWNDILTGCAIFQTALNLTLSQFIDF